MTPDLSGGFAEPAREAALAFRAAMTAMARPGTLHEVAGVAPPAPLSVAAGVLLLTLTDPGTPVHLAGACDTPAVCAWLSFHSGAPLSGPASCAFAVGTWADLGPLAAYPAGTPEYPDRSATLIVELPDLRAEGARLHGPGINGHARLSLPDLPALQANRARFPLGLDFFFTSGTRLAALPRSTRIAEGAPCM